MSATKQSRQGDSRVTRLLRRRACPACANAAGTGERNAVKSKGPSQRLFKTTPAELLAYAAGSRMKQKVTISTLNFAHPPEGQERAA